MKLRPYQEAARQAIQAEWSKGIQKTLLVLPTGTGKTIVFSKVVEDQVRKGDRCLVLAHRAELLDQASDKIQRATGLGCATEKAEQTSLGAPERVAVGSVQTLMRESRLAKFPPDHFSTIVVDEAHHLLSNSYQNVLSHFSRANVLGVTATPDRGDRRSLGEYFESIAYEYMLNQAIKEGYLSPIRIETIPLEINLESVRTQAGDYSAADLGDALDPYLESIADEMKNHAAGRKTVVFLPLIVTSQRFAIMLQKRGFRVAEVNGESENRAEILADFDAGRYDILCNSMLLTEGWDCPSVDCIVVLRPTKIRSLYAQMVGRGTRLCPGKDHLLVLDFLWHTGRHELIRPANLVSANDKVAKKMTKILEKEPMDILAAEEAAKEDAVAEREAALARELEAARKRKRQLVDPLQYELSIEAFDISGYEPMTLWEIAPPSPKQLSYLEKMGINPDSIDCAGKASRIIDRLEKRRKAGLATPKQIRKLEEFGFRHVGTWEFKQASQMMDRIAQNSWRLPYNIDPRTYKPESGYQIPWS